MSDLRDLYQEVILDHSKKPRNFGPLDAANHEAKGHNPLCGDRVTVFLQVGDNGLVNDAHFQGSGCAISMASASLMTELVKGKTEAEAKALFGKFHAIVTGEDEPAGDVSADDMDRLEPLTGVKEFPMRVKCATLPWHTFVAAIDDKKTPVVTE
ncbi:MAG TPA: SUF system NifU family Fe-S cluster assembly protein [Alphaproteobacteria bacterium]|nr:SUF system NifU family Fe-S cluster assembly protein [Alphaproteobacteria bacterium]